MSSCWKTKSGIELLKILQCVLINEVTREVTLKNNHQYYDQIQLGLLLCNISKCNLVIYEQMNDTVFIN